jgi:hypothetical protein
MTTFIVTNQKETTYDHKDLIVIDGKQLCEVLKTDDEKETTVEIENIITTYDKKYNMISKLTNLTVKNPKYQTAKYCIYLYFYKKRTETYPKHMDKFFEAIKTILDF